VLLLAVGRAGVVEGGVAALAVEQLAFQGGKEALGDGVVERVPDGALEATRPEAVRRRP
jgi:hypothetical protein